LYHREAVLHLLDKGGLWQPDDFVRSGENRDDKAKTNDERQLGSHKSRQRVTSLNARTIDSVFLSAFIRGG
jgi:hypothetical protein